jgi:hypothetical protein
LSNAVPGTSNLAQLEERLQHKAQKLKRESDSAPAIIVAAPGHGDSPKSDKEHASNTSGGNLPGPVDMVRQPTLLSEANVRMLSGLTESAVRQAVLEDDRDRGANGKVTKPLLAEESAKGKGGVKSPNQAPRQQRRDELQKDRPPTTKQSKSSSPGAENTGGWKSFKGIFKKPKADDVII